LRVHDIDSARMTIRVVQGKGGKDRHTVLSPRLLEALRAYWRVEHPRNWLFPTRGARRLPAAVPAARPPTRLCPHPPLRPARQSAAPPRHRPRPSPPRCAHPSPIPGRGALTRRRRHAMSLLSPGSLAGRDPAPARPTTRPAPADTS
jgi:hypothetical protein